jgi:putative transposase
VSWRGSRASSWRSCAGCGGEPHAADGARGAQKSRGLLRPGERGALSEVFAFVAAEKANYPASLICRVLEVNRTSFHDWERRAPSDRALYDAWLTEQIKQIHARSGGSYGAPRVHAELRLEHRVRVGEKRVARLMATEGLEGIPVPRKARTTVRVAGVRCAPDLVDRDFTASEPDRLWCADITQLSSWEGWLYLASVIDCFSRRVVGWSMQSHMRLELVEAALQMAVARPQPERGLIHHSDHSSQPGLNRSSQQCVCHVNVRTTGDGQCRPPIAETWLGDAAVVAEARPEGGPRAQVGCSGVTVLARRWGDGWRLMPAGSVLASSRLFGLVAGC